MARLELYGSAGCPFTREAREALEWRRQDFVEYDVEQDARRARSADSSHQCANGAGPGGRRPRQGDRLAGPRLHHRSV